MLRKWFTFPVVRVYASVVLVFVFLLALPNTRAYAGALLNLFRIQQVVVLPIDSIKLENTSSKDAFGSQLSRLISSSTIVTDAPGDPVFVANAQEASEAAGFKVRLLDEMPLSYISVTDFSSFTMKIDHAKAQNFLTGMGRSDLVLPENIDGAEISISIPSSVRTAYGICPKPSDAVITSNIGNTYPDCIVFSQLPSPVVNVPKDLDIEQLAQIGLMFGGMNPEDAEAFINRVDWTTTLVIPIPMNSINYDDVIADGIIGKLIQRDVNSGWPEYVLLWVKGGFVYFINGSGTDTSRAFEIANTLP